MSYVAKVLLPDERVLCITTIHWVIYVEGFCFAVGGGLLAYYSAFVPDNLFGRMAGETLARPLLIIALFIGLIAAALIFGAYLRQVSTELAVTNRRVIAKYGIVARTTYEIMVDRITGANFEQTFLGRLIGYGTVIVHGAGGDTSPFEKIGNPEGFHKALMLVLERSQGVNRRL